MRKNLNKALAVMLLSLSSWSAHASLADCSSLYVGQIIVERGVVVRVSFLANPDDMSGSQGQWFSPAWSAEETRMAVAMLMTAKVAGHRVNIATEGPSGCGITSNGYYLVRVIMANNP